MLGSAARTGARKGGRSQPAKRARGIGGGQAATAAMVRSCAGGIRSGARRDGGKGAGSNSGCERRKISSRRRKGCQLGCLQLVEDVARGARQVGIGLFRTFQWSVSTRCRSGRSLWFSLSTVDCLGARRCTGSRQQTPGSFSPECRLHPHPTRRPSPGPPPQRQARP